VPAFRLLTPGEASLEAIRSLAPLEVEIFSLASAPYLAHPGRMGRAVSRPSDSPLGLGGGLDVSDLTTPVVALVATTVITCATQDSYSAVKPADIRWFGKMFWTVLRPWHTRIISSTKKKPQTIVTITDTQLDRIRKAGIRRARGLGVDSAKADAIVDAVIVACLEPTD